MDDKQKKLQVITQAVEKQINNLQFHKRSGTIELTIRLHMTQGFVASAFIKNVSEENIFQQT